MKKFTIAVAALIVCLFGSFGSAYADSGMRSVWVLSDKPMTLSLQFGGREIDHFNPDWQHTGMGYMAEIVFPISELGRYQSLRLIRADGKGWSNWGADNIAFLRYSNVGKGDPACVGGKNWCAVRGL